MAACAGRDRGSAGGLSADPRQPAAEPAADRRVRLVHRRLALPGRPADRRLPRERGHRPARDRRRGAGAAVRPALDPGRHRGRPLRPAPRPSRHGRRPRGHHVGLAWLVATDAPVTAVVALSILAAAFSAFFSPTIGRTCLRSSATRRSWVPRTAPGPRSTTWHSSSGPGSRGCGFHADFALWPSKEAVQQFAGLFNDQPEATVQDWFLGGAGTAKTGMTVEWMEEGNARFFWTYEDLRLTGNALLVGGDGERLNNWWQTTGSLARVSRPRPATRPAPGGTR